MTDLRWVRDITGLVRVESDRIGVFEGVELVDSRLAQAELEYMISVSVPRHRHNGFGVTDHTGEISTP